MGTTLFGFPTTLGLPRQTDSHAPEVLRAAGLVTRLEQVGRPVVDLGDLPVEEGRSDDSAAERLGKVTRAARRQADFWRRSYSPRSLMLTLGGDHSTSLGTLLALSRTGECFDVVWIDAHGDFNILETSPSQNPHGMVLALATGLMPDWMPQLVSPGDLRLWGIRDLDPGEQALLHREGVEVLSPAQVRRERERIIGRLKPNVFLSFDIDAVDPGFAPGTMTPVPGGFSRHEALDLVAQIARQRRLVALDIVEYHPDQDQAGITANLALEVAAAAVSGQVERQRLLGLGAAAGA